MMFKITFLKMISKLPKIFFNIDYPPLDQIIFLTH